MATKYFMTAGNWGDDTKWSTTSSAGPNNTTKGVAGDDVILDAGSGNCTLAAAAACTTLTCTGYTGTLALATYALTVAGNLTLASGMTVTTSSANGKFAVSAAATVAGGPAACPALVDLSATASYTITSSGTTWAEVRITGGAKTITLGDDLTVTLLNVQSFANTVFAGAHDISAASLLFIGGAVSVSFVAGRKLTLTTGMTTHVSAENDLTTTPSIISGTPSSPTYIAFTGANATALRVFRTAFTDVDFSTYSTPVTNLDNWYGGTLTRTTGITNRTSADLATAAQAGDILDGTTISGVAGTCTLPAEADVETGVQYGAGGTEFTGTLEGGATTVNVFSVME